ncbi:hypothetical protein FQN55_006087 [Onygenales sp. PD_40]|nr:hypothetical protein FQN55_006087 [Onygenales sp. PD_40]
MQITRTGKMISWERLKRAAAVPIDENATYKNTTWCNRDLIPIPPERRTWGVWGYFGYWTSAAGNWMCGCRGNVYGNARGSLWVDGGKTSYRIYSGFEVLVGDEGVVFPGGDSMFWALIPGFAHMKNYFAESSHLTTNDFIGMVIWYIAFIPLVLIPPERLQKPFAISFVLFSSSCIGLLIWARINTGSAGTMFHQPATAPSVGWGVMYGISSILGAWGSGTLGQSDWTRYANRPMAPTLSQLVAAPVTITITALVGIIVTSAANDLFGEIVWNPIYLLTAIQEEYQSSARARVGVFFAAVGMVSTQLAISLVLNSVSTGHGNFSQAQLNSYPGIMLADYHLIRRQKLKLNDLYMGDAPYIYWYWHGINWRAVVAFVAGMWPLFPGLITSVNPPSTPSPPMTGWLRLFNLTFFAGLGISFVAMTVICYISPPPGLGVDEPFAFAEQGIGDDGERGEEREGVGRDQDHDQDQGGGTSKV